MTLLYLAALLVALFGMVVLDRRFTLFFWRDARRAAVVLVVGVLFFFVWDVAGVGNGIFFLTLLCYLTMNVYGAVSGRLVRSGSAQ